MLRVICWPIVAAVAKRSIKKARRWRRKAVGVAVSKPAIAGWICIATGLGFWAGWPRPAYVQIRPSIEVVSGERFEDSIPPLAFVGLPDIFLLPQGPPPVETPQVPVPEPTSFIILITAVAALILTKNGGI